MTNDNVFWIGKDDLGSHIYGMGISGRGKTVLLERVALDLSMQTGMSFEEAMKRFEPSEEMLIARRKEKEALEAKEKKRLNALKEAYWENSDIDDFSRISDACVSVLGILPSDRQLYAIFHILPKDVLMIGFEWGFGDTEAGSGAYQFFEDNQELVMKVLNENA